MIDEQDPENDKDKVNVWETEILGVTAVKYVLKEDNGVVIAVCNGSIQTFNVIQTKADDFSVSEGFKIEIPVL